MAGNATVGALKVVLGLDSAAFTDGLNAAQKHLKGVGQSMQRVGAQLATIGAGMTASVTLPIIAVGVGFSKAAIAAEEMQSAFSVSFGVMAKDTKAWAEATGDAMGRSTFELQEMALGFNGLFKAGGPVTQQAADMARRFTTLAQDLSSFHNVAEQDAFQALRSGLSGESEPLRRFNVYLTEGSVKAEAYALGLAQAGSELSEQAKIQARASLIMKGTVEAQGDVIRTSQGTQNQLRALKSQWNELSVTLGQKILPLLTPVVSRLNEMAKSFSGLSPSMQQIVMVGAAVAAAIGPVLIALGAVVSAVGAVTASFAAGGFLAGIVPFLGPIALAVGAVVIAFMAFKDDIIPVLQSFAQSIRENVGPKIMPLFEALKGAVVAIGNVFATIFGNGDPASASANLKVFGEIIARVFGAAIEIITGAIKIITSVLNAIGAALRGDWSAMWGHLGQAVKAALDGIGRAFATLFPEVVEWVRKMVTQVSVWLTGKLFDVLKSVIGKVKGVSDAFFKLYDAVVGHSYIPDLVTEVGQWMSRLQDVMVEPAQRAAQATADAFAQARRDAAAAVAEMLTDEERAWLEHESRVARLKGGIAAGGRDAGTFQTMLARENAGWDARGLSVGPGIDITPLSEDPGIQALNETWASIQQQISDSREKFADAFEYGIDSALRGDWQGVLSAIVGSSFQDGLKSIGRSLFDAFGGGSGGGGLGSFLSSIMGSIPGFSTGVSNFGGGLAYVHGGEVLANLAPGTDVIPKREVGRLGRGGSGGGDTYYLSGNMMTPEFWAQIKGEVSAGESRSNQWAATNVPGLAQSQTAKQQQHAVGRRRR